MLASCATGQISLPTARRCRLVSAACDSPRFVLRPPQAKFVTLKERVLTDATSLLPGTAGRSKRVAHAVRSGGVTAVVELMQKSTNDAEMLQWCCDALATLTEENGTSVGCADDGGAVPPSSGLLLRV